MRAILVSVASVRICGVSQGAKIIQKAIKPLVLSAVFIGSIGMVQADVQKIYSDSCAACHDLGALNAPKKGDKARWQALKQQKGMEGLVKSVKHGMAQMPAGGLCSTCNDHDYRALINYMSQ